MILTNFVNDWIVIWMKNTIYDVEQSLEGQVDQ